MTTNLIGPFSHHKTVRIGKIMAVGWEAHGSGEVEHGQWLPAVSFPFYLAHVMSLGKAKLTKALVLPLPS